jgi:hypothetical protein
MRAVAFGVGVTAALVTVSVWAASVWAASLDSPDAPLATARYVGPPPSVSATAQAGSPTPVAVADAVESGGPDPVQAVQAALTAARQDIDVIGDRLSGLVTGARYRHEAAFEVARYSAPATPADGPSGWRQRLGAARAPGRQPRVFVFAGDQGGVMTYSFTRTNGQVGAAGWATERADQAGERRVGIAWQRGRTRFALTGLERKFCQFGAEMKDRVLALSVSFSPGSSSNPRDRQPG